MNPAHWRAYFLLVSFNVGRDPVSYLLDHVNIEDFFERVCRAHTRMPSNVSVLQVSEDVFEMLEADYRGSGLLMEGDG